jgi:predicted HicB family RNase H-like nuclease
MQEIAKKKLYEEQLVRSIAKAAVTEALIQEISLNSVDQFIEENLTNIIQETVADE